MLDTDTRLPSIRQAVHPIHQCISRGLCCRTMSGMDTGRLHSDGRHLDPHDDECQCPPPWNPTAGRQLVRDEQRDLATDRYPGRDRWREMEETVGDDGLVEMSDGDITS